MELNSNLPSVVEETVENMMVNKKYSINNTNEFIADLIENLALKLDTRSDIRVEIIEADKDKGILSVHVVETFVHPNGKTGTVACDRNVILNEVGQPDQETYQVDFYIGTECYKSFLVYSGDNITAPAVPKMEGIVFIGWKDENDYLADFTQPVKKNMTYYAEWS